MKKAPDDAGAFALSVGRTRVSGQTVFALEKRVIQVAPSGAMVRQ